MSGDLFFVGGTDKTPCREFFKGGQGDIFAGVHGEDEAEALAIFRDQGKAQAQGVTWVSNGNGFLVNEDFSGGGRIEAEEGLGDLGPSGADQSGQTENFPGPKIEGDILEISRAGEMFDAEADVSRRMIEMFWKIISERAADHHLHKFSLIKVFYRFSPDDLTVAKNGDGVAQMKDVLKVVRDVD